MTKLEKLDEIIMLFSHIRVATRMLAAARGNLIECYLDYDGERKSVFSILPAQPIRESISGELVNFIQDCQRKLGAHGVMPGPAPSWWLDRGDGS